MEVMVGDCVYVLCHPMAGHGGNRFEWYVYAIKSMVVDGVHTFPMPSMTGRLETDHGWLPRVADAVSGWIATEVFLGPDIHGAQPPWQEEEVEVPEGQVQEPDAYSEWFES
jgi:hypothetical protein